MTVPAPVLLAPELMVIQLAVLAAVQEQVPADGVTVTCPVLSPDPTLIVVVDNVYVQDEGMGDGVGAEATLG